MHAFSRLLLCATTVGLAAGCASSSGAANTRVKPNDLQGAWTSAVCEPMKNADGSTTYFQRHFDITEKTWALKFQTYGDAGCTVRLFTARMEGDYKVLQDSERVAGATEANFQFARTYLTAYVQPVADWFQGSGCGKGAWKLGEEQETSEKGCVFIRPVGACGWDHDVVKVEGRQLFFGQRPADNDMCTPDKRPTALGAVAVVRD